MGVFASEPLSSPPDPHLFHPFLSTEMYAIAVMNTQMQCHNSETWQYINTHINGESSEGMLSTQ